MSPFQQVFSKNVSAFGNETLGFKVTDSTHIYNSVVNSMKNAGMRIVSPYSGNWNVMWTGFTQNHELKLVSSCQRINHFPESTQLGRKDLMWKNVARLKKLFA